MEARDTEIARLREALGYYESLCNVAQTLEGAVALQREMNKTRQWLADLTDFRLWP